MFTSFYSVPNENNDDVSSDTDSNHEKCVAKLNLPEGFTDEINKVLTNKTSKMNELNELDSELESQISNLVKGYNFDKDPMEYKSHHTIRNHQIFKDALERYERELDCVSYYNAVSSKYRERGNFFSSVWNNCKLPDDNESNIRAIVIYNDDDETEYVIKHPLNITAFMESYMLPPFYKQSMFSKYMSFENNTWPLVITVYTDKYIYEGYSYDEDYVYNEDVHWPFSDIDNKTDMASCSGYRHHFEYNLRNVENLNDTVLLF